MNLARILLHSIRAVSKQESKVLSFEERVLGKLRRAAVLDISDSEDSNLPGLEDTQGLNKVVLDTKVTKTVSKDIRRFRLRWKKP